MYITCTFLITQNPDAKEYYVALYSHYIAEGNLAKAGDIQVKILNRFNANTKHNIIIEFAKLNEIPLEGVVNIAHELKKKISFIPGPKEFSRGGAKSIATLLNQMSTEESEQYLSQIEQDDPELYAEVKKYFLSFEDLLDMPDHLMQIFWKNPDATDVDILAKALKGQDQTAVDHILSFLPKRKQKEPSLMIKPHLTTPNHTRNLLKD